VLRLSLLATLVLLAAAFGGSKSTSPTTTTAATIATTTETAASGGTTTLSRAEAVKDDHPRVTARAYLTKCRAALGKVRFTVVTKSGVDGAMTQVATVRTACGDAASLRLLAQVNPNDAGLAQAAAAETAILDAAVNFGHYLDHIANGTSGTKIFKFSVEEARQAKILLADAFVELK
jgi:hypothetical protein